MFIVYRSTLITISMTPSIHRRKLLLLEDVYLYLIRAIDELFSQVAIIQPSEKVARH